MRDSQRHGRAPICRQLAAAVKAKPAHPQHRGADHHIARVMRRGGLVFARAQHDCQNQGGQTGGFMHNDAAGKIAHAGFAKDAAIGQETAAPDPMGDWRVAHQHPQRREQQHKAKADALHIGAHDQRRGDDGKGHLKGEKQHFGQAARQGFAVDT